MVDPLATLTRPLLDAPGVIEFIQDVEDRHTYASLFGRAQQDWHMARLSARGPWATNDLLWRLEDKNKRGSAKKFLTLSEDDLLDFAEDDDRRAEMTEQIRALIDQL